jgi:hypothetical protein
VNREEEELGWIMTFSDNFFCPVAMMNVNVHNGTALTEQSLVGYGMHGTGCYAVENAESA